VERAVREALGAERRVAVAGDFGVASPRQAAVQSGVPWVGGEGTAASVVAEPLAAEAAGVGAPALLEAAPPSVLGQHRNTYILATDGEDLILVDQHTAHERVRYEALMDALERRRVESQILLVPLVLALPPRLRPGLEAHEEALREIGFEVEAFGGDAVRVSAVPGVLGGRDPGAALERLLGELLDRDSAEWTVSSAREKLAATLACHSAVRGGQPLGPEPMRTIVGGLWAARQPALCPHGRPTRVRIPRDDVSRWFRRTGWRRD